MSCNFTCHQDSRNEFQLQTVHYQGKLAPLVRFNCERYVNRILRNVIAMVHLAEARGVQLKNSRPLSLPRRPRPESRQSACAALFASQTYYVREAILEHLEEIEDLYLAEGALERIRSGEERTIPLKQVMKRHGLQR